MITVDLHIIYNEIVMYCKDQFDKLISNEAVIPGKEKGNAMKKESNE